MSHVNGLRNAALNVAVIVAALGYFVDIYDLILFSVVRVPSLASLGLLPEDITKQGLFLLNMQMAGTLIGGVLWGVLGDKKGRISTLFGSILLYSLANTANAFVTNVEQYAVLRFIAGIGLAGELGVGITLVSEVLPKDQRGYGTMIVAGIGVTGALLANMVAKLDWRTAYIVGGIMGLALLLLRIKVVESEMFSNVKSSDHKKGSLLQLLSSPHLLKRFLLCILIGMPTWFVVGILVTLAPEFAKAHGITDSISGGDAIAFCYAGLAIGDFLTGWLSQVYKSRRKVMFQFLAFNAFCSIGYLMFPFTSSVALYWWIFVLGISVGFWAIFVTIAAEQFGTNLRATVATTVPNIARGSLNLISVAFAALSPMIGMKYSALCVGIACTIIAILSVIPLEETFGKDMNYVEMS
ncbi:MAG: MFS transporter [Ignavibacteria bacterium]|nr:MFS transporter [Ignavibacteria bacterium]